jgi:tripartite-type tricarboxylate transporter receptor subunit TctC
MHQSLVPPRVRPVLASGFPDRPIRFVVPYAPGGNADSTVRVLAPRLSEALGQPVVVENRAGAGGSVGAAQVARTRADGHTLLLGSNGPLTVNPTLQASLAYDAEMDFAPVGLACRTPLAVAVHRGQPPRSLAELLSHAKADPGRFSVGSAGTGSISHLAIELFNGETGAGLQHIPYGGGGALVPDLVAGTVNGAFTEVSTALPLHREGAIRILGVTAARRLAVAPELPTVEEGGVPGFRAAAFLGIVVPAGTPVEATRALQMALAVALADPGVRQRLEQMGSEIATEKEMTPHGFAAVVAHEMAWTRAAAARAGLRR